jgi:hypothetical protein
VARAELTASLISVAPIMPHAMRSGKAQRAAQKPVFFR